MTAPVPVYELQAALVAALADVPALTVADLAEAVGRSDRAGLMEVEGALRVRGLVRSEAGPDGVWRWAWNSLGRV